MQIELSDTYIKAMKAADKNKTKVYFVAAPWLSTLLVMLEDGTVKKIGKNYCYFSAVSHNEGDEVYVDARFLSFTNY